MASTSRGGGPRSAATGLAVRLRTNEHEEIPRTGPTSSVHEAELVAPRDVVPELLTARFLEQVACGYGRFLNRVSLGLLRTRLEPGYESIVLVLPWPSLLRLHAPVYDEGPDWAEVRWDIDRGLLVAREGRGRGFLRIRVQKVARDGETAGTARLVMRMEVAGYYPSCRGRGMFAPAGTWLYAQTQARIHRLVMRGFVRSLAGVEPSPGGMGGSEPAKLGSS